MTWPRAEPSSHAMSCTKLNALYLRIPDTHCSAYRHIRLEWSSFHSVLDRDCAHLVPYGEVFQTRRTASDAARRRAVQQTDHHLPGAGVVAARGAAHRHCHGGGGWGFSVGAVTGGRSTARRGPPSFGFALGRSREPSLKQCRRQKLFSSPSSPPFPASASKAQV